MKRYISALYGIALLVTVSLVSYTTFAQQPTAITTAEPINAVTTGVYDKTIYRAGETVAVYDVINGDLYCFGNKIIIDAVIDGDVLCFGNSVTVGGTINGNIRVAGNYIEIDSKVGGSATLSGANVDILPDASIGSDATIAAKTANILGTIQRDATIRANSIIITGDIARNMRAFNESLTINNGATIGGNVEYSSPTKADIPDGTVSGTVTHISVVKTSPSVALLTGSVFIFALLYIAWFISLIIASVGVAALFPKSLDDSVRFAKTQPLITSLAGAIAVVVVPFGIGLLLLSIIGIPLGLIIGALLLVAILLSTPFVAHFIGSLIFPKRSHVIRALLGTVILLLLYAIPFVNMIVMVLVTIFGTGLVLRVATERYSTAATIYKQSTTLSNKIQGV